MRFMLDGPAFLADGQYIEATLDAPKIIDVPVGTDPSFKWIPLDKEAQAALEKYSAEKIARIKRETDPKVFNEGIVRRDCAIRLMPKGAERAAKAAAIHMRPVEKPQPGAREQSLLERALGGTDESAPPSTKPVMRRPSDQEPE